MFCFTKTSIVHRKTRNLAISNVPDPNWANPSFQPESLYYWVGKLRPSFFKKASPDNDVIKKIKINALVKYETMQYDSDLEFPYRLAAEEYANACCQIRLKTTWVPTDPKTADQQKEVKAAQTYKSFFQAWILDKKFIYNNKYWNIEVNSAEVFYVASAKRCPNLGEQQGNWGEGTMIASNNVWDEVKIKKVAAKNPCVEAMSGDSPNIPDKPDVNPTTPDCPADSDVVFHLVITILQVLVNRGIFILRWEVTKNIKVTISITQEFVNHIILQFNILVYKFKEKNKTEVCTFQFFKHKEANKISKIVITGPEDPCGMILQFPWNDPDKWPFTPIEFDAGRDIYMIQIILDLLQSNKITTDIDLDFDNNKLAALFISVVQVSIHYQFVVAVKDDIVCYFKVVRQLKNQVIESVEIRDVNKKGVCAGFLVKPPPNYPVKYPVIPVPSDPVKPVTPQLQVCSDVYYLIPNFIRNQLFYLIQTGYINKSVWTANKKNVESLNCMTIMDNLYIMYHITVNHPDKPNIQCTIIFTKNNENSLIHSVSIKAGPAECNKGILIVPPPGGDKGPLCPLVDPEEPKKPDEPIIPDKPKDDPMKPTLCAEYTKSNPATFPGAPETDKNDVAKASKWSWDTYGDPVGRFTVGDNEAYPSSIGCSFAKWSDFWATVFKPLCIYMNAKDNAVKEWEEGPMIFHKDMVKKCEKSGNAYLLEFKLDNNAKTRCAHQFTIYGNKPTGGNQAILARTGCLDLYQKYIKDKKYKAVE